MRQPFSPGELGQQDADLWESLSLQASHSQPAVRHALIAVASVHESLELSENDTLGYNDAVARQRWTFSLIHYNKAVQLLIKDYQQSCDRLATAIVMYVLFIVFEDFQSGNFACTLHLREWPSGLATIGVVQGQKLLSGTSLSEDFTGWCPCLVLGIVGSYGGS